MPRPDVPGDPRALLAAIDHQLASLVASRETALDRIVALDAEQAALGYHPNYPAYVHGGIYADKGFGSGHILAVAGFHDLDWREALDRLTTAPADVGDDPDCLLVRLRHACEADAMLEVSGLVWCDQVGLLKRGAINAFWIKRPKLGLGQPAKAAGLGPGQAAAHRGLYSLSIATLARGFDNAAVNQPDHRFGAMLSAVIETGGSRLARIGAEALHRDAEARYRDDCRSFAAHQAATSDRHWRWKPPLSRQGHLAVTTARAKDIAMPTERTRGHAASWLDDHDANIRFTQGDEA
ncbi:hypothetical protein QH494_12435 [Sphingomonas sp. AR_OL41]|uniref:hypothetical protein n=1 Tax=Sphingomonas sp. AR_OL41 TaxID=3042729 RepID=UPI0024816606|nr:hypothetical protein [Sphingomonas sp. AR_OL41]MDH7972986.1 hypothetical protein [Sphingomonas sp. AR_OL41]